MTDVLDPGRLRSVLRAHVFEPWFPQCLDRQHGGYLCDFDHRWRPTGDNVKMLEFQARQTRVAALAVRRDPADASMREACLQGWEALRDGLWDAEQGGWYACADRGWAPMRDGEKHAHGMAYAILACLDVGRALDLPEAVERARESFAWLDDHAWDPTHGGYWGWMRRDGRPHATASDRAPRARDHLGHGAELKSANVAGDMVETLAELHTHIPTPRSAERLATLVNHFEGWLATTGGLPTIFEADLTPVEAPPHGGYAIQASWRLPVARAALGEPLLLAPGDRAFREWGASIQGRHGFVMDSGRLEEWWMQYELFRSLMLDAGTDPERSAALTEQAGDILRRTERSYLDTSRRGVRQLPTSLLRRSPKGTRWKDGSHEGMAYDVCARLIARGVGAPPPTLAELSV